MRVRKYVLLLVLSSGVASTYPIPWRFMFRAATRGERHGGAVLVTGGAAALAVGTVGGRCGGATTGLLGLVSTFLGAVSEGDCGYGWSSVANLEGGLLRANLGGGAASRGNTTSNFSGAGVGFGARR